MLIVVRKEGNIHDIGIIYMHPTLRLVVAVLVREREHGREGRESSVPYQVRAQHIGACTGCDQPGFRWVRLISNKIRREALIYANIKVKA